MILARASGGGQPNPFEVTEAFLLANQPGKAVPLLDSVLSASPKDARAIHLKGLAAASQGSLREAIALLRGALSYRPEPMWFRDLGFLEYAAGKTGAACRSFTRAWNNTPPNREFRNLYARALMDTGHPGRALSLFKSFPSAANDVETLLLHAEALIRNRRWTAAIALLKLVSSAEPANQLCHELCAIACACTASYDDALHHRREVLLLAAGRDAAQQALATALFSTGEMAECLTIGQSLLDSGTRTSDFHFSHLVALDHTTHSAAVSRDAWQQFAAIHCAPSATPAVTHSLDPHRRLRVGYLVENIHKLPDCHFIPPLLECRDREHFTTFCYLTSSGQKNYHRRLQPLAEHTRDVRPYTLPEIARRIRSDEIDILVNASWDTRQKHLQVFAYRPASIQIELPHYPATTGVAQTDYIFTDQWICPPGSESMYTERVYRLPLSYLPWKPPAHTPAVSALPMIRNRFCTFGFFQKPAKLNPAVWDAIAAILRGTPASALLIHQYSHDLDNPGSATRRRYVEELATRGIPAERLRFAGRRPGMRHLAEVAKVDIALDSFPYNGTTTTHDCLWMGVPVITFAGETHAGRVGFASLARLGLERLVAHEVQDYIDTAIALAHCKEELTAFRAGLRDLLIASGVTTGAQIMHGIERALRDIWTEHCLTKG